MLRLLDYFNAEFGGEVWVEANELIGADFGAFESGTCNLLCSFVCEQNVAILESSRVSQFEIMAVDSLK